MAYSNWTMLLKVFEEEAYWKDMDKKKVAQVIDSSFIYSCVWSICISIDTDGRKKFDKYFKSVCEGQAGDHLKKFTRKLLPSILDRGTIYDYVFMAENNEWKNWQDLA